MKTIYGLLTALLMVSALCLHAGDPVHFKFSDNTGANATVIFPPGSLVGAEIGDEVGVFNAKGDLAGSSRYESGYMAIAAWGNESGTNDKSHLASGEKMNFKIWKKSLNKEFDLSVSFSSGPANYMVNGISTVGRATYNAPAVVDNDPPAPPTPPTPPAPSPNPAPVPTGTHFAFSDNTGSNATIIFPPASLSSASAGDEIGVFNAAGNLAGAAVYTGDYTAIAAWGNESGSGDRKHLAEGEKYRFRIWKKATNTEHDLAVTFASGPDHYTTNGISMVASASVQGAGTETPETTEEAGTVGDRINIDIELSGPSRACVCIYDESGSLALTTSHRKLPAETGAMNLDISGLASGTYTYRIDTNERMYTGTFTKR